MADSGTSPRVTLKDGKLISPRIIDKVTGKIEHGALAAVHAIVLHQTGSSTAASSLSSYNQGKNGAHFLIDKDGTIYQTARIDRMCWHVGKIRSRCYALKSCDKAELKDINAILYKKGDSYVVRVTKLSDYESEKSYPDRFPTNADSLGIELVGALVRGGKGYEAVTEAQNSSLSWILSTLESTLKLTASDIYTHPQVSYKNATEAATASRN